MSAEVAAWLTTRHPPNAGGAIETNGWDPTGLCGWGDPWNCGDEVVDAAGDAVDTVAGHHQELLEDPRQAIIYRSAGTFMDSHMGMEKNYSTGWEPTPVEGELGPMK